MMLTVKLFNIFSSRGLFLESFSKAKIFFIVFKFVSLKYIQILRSNLGIWFLFIPKGNLSVWKYLVKKHTPSSFLDGWPIEYLFRTMVGDNSKYDGARKKYTSASKHSK